jgi:hydrogenase maturation protease
MKESDVKILFYGYGNPGRKDDGLGPALADMVEKWTRDNNYCNIDVDTNYQLNIEDACSISDYDIVIFADASIEQIEDFKISLIHPSSKTNFSMHSAYTYKRV